MGEWVNGTGWWIGESGGPRHMGRSGEYVLWAGRFTSALREGLMVR